MQKKAISLIALILCTSLVGACNGKTSSIINNIISSNNSNSVTSSNNNDSQPSDSASDSGHQYSGDSNETPISSSSNNDAPSASSNPSSELPSSSSNPVSSSDIISSSIDSSSSSSDPIVVVDPLDQMIADFVSDLDVTVPSVSEYHLEYTVFYYYYYESYVISLMCEDTNEAIADAYAELFDDDTNLVSQNDDEYYPVEDYGYLFGDASQALAISFYNEDGYFFMSLARYDGLAGSLDVSSIDTNWYVDYINLQSYTLLDEFPATQIKDMLGIANDINIPSLNSNAYPSLFAEAYEDEEGNYYPDTFYVILEDDQLSNYVQALKKAGFTAELEEHTDQTIDWDTFEIVDYTYYTGYGYDEGKNVYISFEVDEEGNTVLSFNLFIDLFSTNRTSNDDWTNEEKALMNETLHQVLPFMAFGEDYQIYDASDDDWTLLVLVDSYYEDLTEDYINLLLEEGFFIDDVTWDDTYYCFDNGVEYIEIYIAYEYGGNYLEIYYEPTHLGELTSLQLSNSYVDIVAGASYQLSPKYNPANATYPITWSSSNEDLATVDNKGLVTINSDATVDSEVIITASTIVGKTASCTFGIHDNVVTGIAFLENEYIVIPGADPYIPAYTLMPYGVTTNDTVTYRLGNGDNGLHYNEKGELWADADAAVGTEDTLFVKINDFEDNVSVKVISGEVTHTLDRDFFGIQKENYSKYLTYKKTTDDGASYETYAAGNNGIQLKSKTSDSGIIGHFEGRTCKSITITFDANTEAPTERAVDIYASNSPFTITDMFGLSVTKAGSIVFDKNNLTQTYTFTGNYSYIGIRSNNGAVYLSSIKIIWK